MERPGFESRASDGLSPEPPAAASFVTPLMVVDDEPLSAEDCAIGEVVAGKYLIEGVIGRGSMGVVVRATHLGFDELVAVKFIRPEMRHVDGIVSRFAREAKASVRIRNEHAVNVLDVGVADPIGPFFVMEYLEGINLEELVDSQGAFDSETAVRYVLEACEALAAAHAQGIIHRDIKPQNMFLAWQGRLEIIKLLDFGISKAALRGQMFGDDLSNCEKDWVMGTPLYMSPEQLRHAPDVDERTDIWSLGAVLHELLCGQPLFSGDTQTAVCRQVLEVGARPPRPAIAGVPDGLWDVIDRCLLHDKEQRFASVAELGQALLPFAPPGACLHVERARALLGLRPMDFPGLDDGIEDLDVEPIADGPELATLPVAGAAPAGPGGRRPYWVELAVPVLACAVGWVAVRQWQLSRDNDGELESGIQTAAFALRQAAACLAPPAAASPSGGPQRSEPGGTPAPAASATATDMSAPGSALPLAAPGAVGTGELGAPASVEAARAPAALGPSPVRGAVPAAPAANAPAAARAAASSISSGPTGSGPVSDGTIASGLFVGDPSAFEPVPVTPGAITSVGPRASNGVRYVPAHPAPAASASAASGATGTAGAPPAPAATAEARPAQAQPAAARSASKPKPRIEPKLEFKLIDERPPAGLGLVPSTEPPRPSIPLTTVP